MSDDETSESESIDDDDDLMTPIETLCRQLHRNEVTCVDIPDDFQSEAITNNYEQLLATNLPFLLAGSLMGNSSLERLEIRLGPGLTEPGARALVEGIRRSNIQRLTLSYDDDFHSIPMTATDAINFVFFESIKNVCEVHCYLEIDDTAIRRLGMVLDGNQVLLDMCLHVTLGTTKEGLDVLFAGMRNSQISSLEFTLPNIENTPTSVLLQGFMNVPTLRRLHLQSAWDDPFDNEVVTHNKPDEKMWDGPIQEVGNHMIVLPTPHFLEHLSISYYFMNVNEVKMLAQGLGNLVSLNLSVNGIDDVAIKSFVENWDSQSRLEELSLQANRISLEGLCVLLRVTKPSLKKICVLDNNIDFGFQTLVEASRLLAVSHLVAFEISLWEVPPTDSKAIKAQKAAAEAAGRALLIAVEFNYTLQDMNLYMMELDERFKTQIQFYLDLNKGGRRRLMEHDFAPTLWCHALAKFQDDASTIFYYLREFPGLVSWFPSNDGNKRRYQGRSSNSCSGADKRRKQIESNCNWINDEPTKGNDSVLSKG